MNVRRCLVVAALALSPLAPALHAQDKAPVPAIPFEGAEVFCYLLKTRGMTPVSSVADLARQAPADTLVILFGKLDALPALRTIVGSLYQFQRAGGAVLLASDYACDLPEYGLRIDGGTVRNSKLNATKSYRNTEDCPLIEAIEQAAPADFRPLPQGLATNRPSYFTGVRVGAGELPPPALQPLLRFHAEVGERGERYTLPYAWIAPDADAKKGRAILVAGTGSFTNGMLVQRDSDNFPFATQCLDYLGKRADGKRRGRALFIVDGKVITNFDVGLQPPPLPIPPVPLPSIKTVNKLIYGIEKEGLLFQILEDTGTVQIAVRVGLIGLTVALLLYGAKKLTEVRHRRERGSVLLSGTYAVPADTAPLAEQRARAQIDRNALAAEARALVRAWFLDACAIPVSDWDRTPLPTPQAIASGGWWQRYRLRRALAQLTRLAGPEVPASFSWGELVRLTATVQTLSAAMHQGTLRVGARRGVRPPVERHYQRADAAPLADPAI